MTRALRQRWRWIALALIGLPLLIASAVLLWPSDDGTIGPVRGLMLGQGPAQARERLRTEGAPGRFRSSAMGEDFALDWVPEGDARGPLRSARLEFHLGQLVAARLVLSPSAPEASGPPLTVSEGSIVTREPRGGAVELTWLARGCPTHAREVRQRIGAP